MKTVYTLHRINGDIEPSQVIEMKDSDAADMLALGAVREPTDAERALFKATRPAAQPKGQKAMKAPKTKPSTDDLLA